MLGSEEKCKTEGVLTLRMKNVGCGGENIADILSVFPNCLFSDLVKSSIQSDSVGLNIFQYFLLRLRIVKASKVADRKAALVSIIKAF